MRKLILSFLTVLLLCCAAAAQQAAAQQPQPLTFYYDYKVNPGKEEEFMNLVRTVGAPVRDKLMADGVILAWGLETPILRYPGGTPAVPANHLTGPNRRCVRKPAATVSCLTC